MLVGGLLASGLVGLLLFVLLCFDYLAALCDCELSNALLPGVQYLGGLFIWVLLVCCVLLDGLCWKLVVVAYIFGLLRCLDVVGYVGFRA